jgi:hypothetical protein
MAHKTETEPQVPNAIVQLANGRAAKANASQMIKCATLFLVLLSFGSQAALAERDKLSGIDAISCSDWTRDHRDPNSKKVIAEEAWLGGFITGVNAYRRHKTAAPRTTVSGISTWIANYCHAHPRDRIARAARALAQAMQKQERACQSDLC